MTHYQTEKFCNDPQTSTITIKSSRNNSLLPRKTLQLLKTTHYHHQIINYYQIIKLLSMSNLQIAVSLESNTQPLHHFFC